MRVIVGTRIRSQESTLSRSSFSYSGRSSHEVQRLTTLSGRMNPALFPEGSGEEKRCLRLKSSRHAQAFSNVCVAWPAQHYLLGHKYVAKQVSKKEFDQKQVISSMMLQTGWQVIDNVSITTHLCSTSVSSQNCFGSVQYRQLLVGLSELVSHNALGFPLGGL